LCAEQIGLRANVAAPQGRKRLKNKKCCTDGNPHFSREPMMTQKTSVVSGAIAAVAVIAAQIGRAAALPLPSPAGTEKAVSPQVEKAYWCGW
jgi:hypothetical protein